MEILAQRLKELRAEKGLSARALGKIIGVSDVTVCRWENNKSDITGENLFKLSRFFNVSADYLLGLEE
jgi:transcriptional regulator with XRE-family HTH domain